MDVGNKQPLYLRKKKVTTTGIGVWSSGWLSPLGRGGLTYKTLKRILELEFIKQANGMSSRLQRMMDQTLWTPSETEKEAADRAGARKVEAPAPTTRERERENFG
jgi:hypothetical protein